MRSRLPDRCGPVGARARPTNHRSGSPSAGHYSSQAESPHQPRIALARHQAAGCRGRFIIPAIIPNEANPDSDHSGSNIVALQALQRPGGDHADLLPLELGRRVGAPHGLGRPGLPGPERHPAHLRALLARGRRCLLCAAPDHLERALLRRLLVPGGDEAQAERRKASVRAKAEHPFLYVKRHFGCAKVRYRGLEKNRQRLALLLGFANLLRAEPQLA